MAKKVRVTVGDFSEKGKFNSFGKAVLKTNEELTKNKNSKEQVEKE